MHQILEYAMCLLALAHIFAEGTEMDGVIRYLARDALAESLKQAIAKNEPGMWVRAADFDERQAQGKQREVALQDRLTALEEWADELGPVILNALRDEDTVRDPPASQSW